MGKKTKCATAGPDPNAWMVTFGDLVTLMLTFFVLLLSMSSMDNQKFKEMANPSSGKFLKLTDEEASGQRPFSLMKIDLLLQIKSKLEMLAKKAPKKFEVRRSDVSQYVQHSLNQTGQGDFSIEKGTLKQEQIQGPTDDPRFNSMEPAVELADESLGIRVVIPEQIAFLPGKTQITPEARDILQSILGVVSKSNLALTVVGHSDDQPPPSGPFESNVLFSCARAASVARYVTDSGLLSATRLRTTGVGDLRPLRPNRTAEDRQANRRLELWVEPLDHWAKTEVPMYPMSLFQKPRATKQTLLIDPKEEKPAGEGLLMDSLKKFILP